MSITFFPSSTSANAALQLPYAGFHFNNERILANNMTTTSTAAITVDSTAGYTAPGAILIGTEIITYTTIPNSTTFDGTIVRGAYGTTKSAHSIGAAVTSVQATTANTRTAALFNVTDYSNGITLSGTPSSDMTCDIGAVYNIQFSFQYSNPDTQSDNVTIWYSINGSDISDSAGTTAVPPSHAGFSGQIILGWNLILPLNAGDVFRIYWSTASGNSVLTTYPAGTAPIHPISPATSVTFQFVSGLY